MTFRPRGAPSKALENCHRKRTYKDADTARHDAVKFSQAFNWQRPLVPYRCPQCNLWHLTTAHTPAQLKRVRKWQRETEDQP